MATAFSERERTAIDGLLQKAALHCAATLGMRRTTVDQLTREAGISKGAFYSFYDSKEHLFLRMLETLHNDMYGNAERALEERKDLPIRRRTALAIREVCRVMEENDLMTFMRDELPTLLRRLPPEDIAQHYQSDESRIRRLVEKANVPLTESMDVTCTVIRLLLMNLVNRNEAGPSFDQALDVLVEAVCDRLIVKE